MKPIARFSSLAMFAVLPLVLGLLKGQTFPDPWIDPGYVKRVAITNVNPVDSSQPLTDFPVLVSLTNATWLDNILADGGDITFAGADGKQFFHEVEQFDNTTKTLTAWVCIPTLSNQTLFYMYWRNTGALTFNASNSTTTLNITPASLVTPQIASNTWDSNFIMVWHLANTNGRPTDSTRYNLNCTTNSQLFSSNQSGVGFSRGYYSLPQGTDQASGLGLRTTNHKASASMALWMTNNASVTFSFWFKHETYPSNATYMGTNIAFSNAVGGGATTNTNKQIVMFAAAQANSTGGGDGVGYLVYDQTCRPTASLNTKSGTSTTIGILSNQANIFSPLSGGVLDNWGYFAVSGGASTGKLVLNQNGQAWTAYTGAFTSVNALADIYVFGGTAGGSAPNWSRRYTPWGWGDEVRYSMTTRSSNWTFTEYSNTIKGTNMAVFNGVQAAATVSVSNGWVSLTNVASKVSLGATFRGVYFAGLGVATNRLVISNVTGGEVYNAEVNRDSSVAWSATPILPTGNYTATAVITASNGFVTNSNPVTFQLVISSSVTVMSLTGSGVAWADGRIQGPLGNGAVGNRILSNNSLGLVAFSNLYSGDTIALINYTPVLWGGSPATSNFVMPESNTTIRWVLDAAWTAVDANSNASGKLDTVYFIASQSPTLKLSITQASKATQRVVIEACPLYGGRRVGIFDGIVTSSDPVARIEGSDLRRLIKPGIWVLEFRSPPTGQDASQAPVNRRLLFYAQ